jgi:peptide/nickel transport system substrate-binding protein
MRAIIVGMTLTVCFALGSWGAHAAIGDSPNQPLVIAFKGGAVTLDPIMRSESTTTAWQQHIFDTITIEGTHGSLEPRITVKWQSIDPTTWRLTLREGVKFQDGTPMTLDDVGESILDTGQNPKSQFREDANDVTGYKVVTQDTIDVNFSRPGPQFPLHLDGTNDRYLEDSLVEQAIGWLLPAVGIKVEVNSIPKAVSFPMVDKGNFTIYFAG